jgi:hypothetical protein
MTIAETNLNKTKDEVNSMRHFSLPTGIAVRAALLPFVAVQLATGARAQTINQLFGFSCTGSGNKETCANGARPDILIQASDGNFYGAAEVTTGLNSN